MSEVATQHITVTGIVQGVGFRPFVYALAQRHALAGWVLNTAFGVEIIVSGPPDALDAFFVALRDEAPPLAVLDSIQREALDPAAVTDAGFTIRHSAGRAGDFVPVSPDVALCDDCRRELFDPGDRRYRYPFINCTNCGPRYTIIRGVPYDRPLTTMAPFAMCPACQAEYDDPAHRRFHAQPNACPDCGPQLTLRLSSHAAGTEPSPGRGAGAPAGRGSGRTPQFSQNHDGLEADAALIAAQRILAAGGIVAVKGLGGYHLACDATNPAAVDALRSRKGRGDKPFAVMVRDLATVHTFAHADAEEMRLLQARSRPILLLAQRSPFPLAVGVAPGNPTVGVMLPYAPLHELLLQPSPEVAAPPAVLVMTSGNLAEEPIITDDDEALARLAPLADAFLTHNRAIHIHCDDSVVRRFQGETMPIRRGRGLAPLPVRLPFEVAPLLAVGAELKNTLCLTRDRYAFLSQHIGDMENLATLAAFERVFAHLRDLFRCEPSALVCDMHPGYLSTRWAEEHAAATGLPLRKVQHHHAHLAAVMAEHGLPLDSRVIGVICDGTGYGPDGTIWGGEVLVGGYAGYDRVARLRPFPLPGGDAAIKRPYRAALAQLWDAGLAWDAGLPPVQACPPAEQSVLRRQLETGLNCVPTSSLGRLFDAAAALAGVRQTVGYEAQAALEFEALLAGRAIDTSPYPFPVVRVASTQIGTNVRDEYPLQSNAAPVQWEWDARPLVTAIAADVSSGVDRATIAGRFHQAVAATLATTVRSVADATGIDTVALSGGVFQNTTLLAWTLEHLARVGLASVLVHRHVPPNDGGLALGQALIAHARQATEQA